MWSKVISNPFLVVLLIVVGGILAVWSKHSLVDNTGLKFFPPQLSVPKNAVYSRSELGTDKQVKELTVKADKTLAEMRKTSERFHLKFGGAGAFTPTSGGINYNSYDTPTHELRSNDHWFFFKNPEDISYSYVSLYFSDVVIGKDAPFAKKPFEPKWTADQAIEIGTAFLAGMIDASVVHLEKPKAKYNGQRYVDGPKFLAGMWTITWNRLDDKGYPFQSNGVKMELSEDWGVTTAAMWLGDSYVEEKKQPMTADAALKIAKDSHPAMGTHANDIVDYTVKSSDLMIVEPHYVAGKPCRLAWVIWLQPVRSTFREGPTWDDSQEVTVDALTGQIIGNNAML